MTDLSFINQAQSAYQDAQAKSIVDRTNGLAKQNNVDFASVLSAEQRKDPTFIDAMQRRKIRETAQEFEAQFLGQMLQPMFEGIEVEEPFGGGHAEKMWQGMLVNEYGKAIANSGGIGLADSIERELLRAQEGL